MLFVSQTPVTVKSYKLHRSRPIIQIPDEFDETIIDEIKQSSKSTKSKSTAKPLTTKPPTAKPPSTIKKTSKSTTTSKKTETVNLKSKKSKKVVSDVDAGQSRQVVTRSKDSKCKSTTIKIETTSSSVINVWDNACVEWFDDKVFDTKRMKHTPKVKKETPPPDSIACLKCNEVFPNVDELTKHEKKCYVKYSYNCLDSTCHRTFSQKSLMNQHYRSTHLGEPFLCRFKDCTFSSKKSRDRHEKAVHKIKKAGVTFKYNCSECEYKTDDKTDYTSHCDHHNNFKRFKCGNCNEGFFSQSHLTNHLKHKCKTSVTDSGSGKAAPKNEEECSKCGQTFKSRNAHKTHFIEKHVKTVTGEMLPHCELCLFVFTSKKGYEAHCTHSTDHEKRTKFL